MTATSKNPKYDKAVATLVRNAGNRVRRVLQSRPAVFSDKQVRVLAGTSPENQRYVIDRAEAGDRNPFKKTATSVQIYETVSFREVISRLERALGQLRDEAAYLRSVRQKSPFTTLPDRMLTLRLLVESAMNLEAALAPLEVVNIGPSPQVDPKTDNSRSPTPKVHAATALGLVAKNLRNVPQLKPEHLPTAAEKARAIAHCQAISREAKAALREATRKWGHADAGCRVVPKGTVTRRIITHADPDADAVVGTWLAEQFLFDHEAVEILFVPRERVLGAMRVDDCLVDVGSTNDAANLHFDHKPPACVNRNDSCAARLVWDRLLQLGQPVQHLRPLVDVVFAGDSLRERPKFRSEYAESCRVGVHKILADAKNKEGTDAGVYRVVRRWLDAYQRRMATAD